MECKFCQAEMPEDAAFCPYCGKNNREDLEETVAAVEEAVEENGEVTVLVEGEAAKEETEMVEEVVASPQVKRMKRFAILSGCLAVLAILGTVLFFGIRGSGDGSGDGWNVASWFAWMKPRQDTLLGNDSYSVSDSKAEKKRLDVVASMPGAELTNGQLQIYYWMQVIEFINDYGYYLSYVGMDYTAPLDEQASMEDGYSWQQYFLESALDMWQSNQSFAQMAKEAGYELDSEYREYLDGLATSLNEAALEAGFEDATAMLKKEMGAGCTLEDYLSYMETYYTGYMYFGELYDALDPSDADIEKYFAENESSFAENKITKDSGQYYTIRHIQINVEGEAKDDEGNTIYLEEDWNHCKSLAQKLLDSWLAGEMTEESFTALVKDNSDDSNSAENGGKYAGFTKGDLVSYFGEEYDNWVADPERKPGDCALVQSSLGYHLVYFVEAEDIWYAEAYTGLMDQLGGELVQKAIEEYPVDVDYKKIVLGEVNLAG